MKRGPGPGWTVLVTGASSGLGRCLALELAGRGCTLVLSGRSTSRLELVATEARSAGSPRVETVVADLAVAGGVEGLCAALESLELRVDALVNNAGAGRAGAWASGSVEGDRALWRLLVDAPMVLTRSLMETWRERGHGAVLNVGSTGAFQPGPQTAVYYAAKAFLVSWSLALAREERSWLTVTTLCPGALKTGFAGAAGRRDVALAPGPEAAARVAVRAWAHHRGLVVPGALNKALVFASRLAPPAWTAAAVEALQRAVADPSVKKR